MSTLSLAEILKMQNDPNNPAPIFNLPPPSPTADPNNLPEEHPQILSGGGSLNQVQPDPSRAAYQKLMDHYGSIPQSDDYKPSPLRRLGAIALGFAAGYRGNNSTPGGGPMEAYKAATDFNNAPYKKAMDKWHNEEVPLEKTTQLETQRLTADAMAKYRAAEIARIQEQTNNETKKYDPVIQGNLAAAVTGAKEANSYHSSAPGNFVGTGTNLSQIGTPTAVTTQQMRQDDFQRQEDSKAENARKIQGYTADRQAGNIRLNRSLQGANTDRNTDKNIASRERIARESRETKETLQGIGKPISAAEDDKLHSDAIKNIMRDGTYNPIIISGKLVDNANRFRPERLNPNNPNHKALQGALEQEYQKLRSARTKKSSSSSTKSDLGSWKPLNENDEEEN